MASLIVLEKRRIKECRAALDESGYYDDSRRIGNVSDDPHLPWRPSDAVYTEKFALPISEECMETFRLLQEKQLPLPHPFESSFVAQVSLSPSKKTLHEDLKLLLQSSIVKHLRNSPSEHKLDEMVKSLPVLCDRHGDLVVLPSASFSSNLWKSHLDSLSDCQLSSFWTMVSSALKCRRLALGSAISSDGFRSSKVTLLLGNSGWVDHVDNGIRYMFDVTKCMFSSGNITEKLRLAKFDCRGETVVDLYAGIGYFVLPYLVHAGADLVHACEWNPHAVEALKRGLKVNKVEDRCIVHFGDNREAGLINIADRVNVGIIPSSEEGWPLACAALKRSSGGWLHIHGNVTMKSAVGGHSVADPCSDQQQFDRYSHLLSLKCLRYSSVTRWINSVVEQVLSFLQLQNSKLEDESIASWSVEVRHVEHVKSYAPHISHLVLDLECRPVRPQSS